MINPIKREPLQAITTQEKMSRQSNWMQMTKLPQKIGSDRKCKTSAQKENNSINIPPNQPVSQQIKQNLTKQLELDHQDQSLSLYMMVLQQEQIIDKLINSKKLSQSNIVINSNNENQAQASRKSTVLPTSDRIQLKLTNLEKKLTKYEQCMLKPKNEKTCSLSDRMTKDKLVEIQKLHELAMCQQLTNQESNDLKSFNMEIYQKMLCLELLNKQLFSVINQQVQTREIKQDQSHISKNSCYTQSSKEIFQNLFEDIDISQNINIEQFNLDNIMGIDPTQSQRSSISAEK